MNFNKDYCLLFIIIMFGCFIRLINLDKSCGLWYDEVTIYSIASQESLEKMLQVDAHRFLLFPLYYVIYHFWLIIWGNSDLTIRLMSCFFDILSLICTFFVGKELAPKCNCKENKTGLIYASLYCINSLIIYYAQEAKFYSLSLLLVNLIILFWLKYIENQNVKNFILFYISSLTLILSYTTQCLFIFILYSITVIYFKKSKIAFPKMHFIIYLSTFIPIILFLLIIPNYFSGNFDAVSIDLSFILILIQNFFTPILNSLQNNLGHYEIIFILNLFKIPFIIFVLFPMIFMIYSIFKSTVKEKMTKYLLALGIFYVLIHLLLTYITDYNVLIRYCIPILPIFLMICSIGISKLKRLTTYFIYIFICLVVLFSQYSAVKLPRPDGYKQLGMLLENNNIQPYSDFILPIRTNLLDKYYYILGNRYSLYSLNNEDFQKTYLTKNEINNLSIDKYNAYKRYFQTDNISLDFENLVCERFIKHNDLVLIVDKTITMYNNEQIYKISESNEYKNLPLQFLRLSKLNNDLLYVFQKKLKLINKIEDKDWIIFVFTK